MYSEYKLLILFISCTSFRVLICIYAQEVYIQVGAVIIPASIALYRTFLFYSIRLQIFRVRFHWCLCKYPCVYGLFKYYIKGE